MRGDMTTLGTTTMTYDAEGRQISTTDNGVGGQSISYAFDAEGQRVAKQVAGGATVIDVHDAFGQLAVEYSSASLTAACNTCYLAYDGVGSVRLVTDENGNVVARHDYLPYGEEIPNGAAGRIGNFGYSSNLTQGFTGQELDGATATMSSGTAELEYFNARHMSAVLGSFTQPDPMQAGADFLNPQSWNGYAYVLGNPLGLVDPSGMDTIYSGIQNGACPASQQTCGPPGGSFQAPLSAGLPNDLETAYQSYASGVAQSFFISQQGAGLSFDDGKSFEPVSFDAIFQSVLSSWTLGLNGSSIGSDPGGPGGRTPGGPPGNVSKKAWLWATTGTHAKVHGLWTYGNWCGTGGSGAPTDDLDAACLLRDYCYATHGLTAFDNLRGANSALQSCNRDLCDSANAIRQRKFPLSRRQAANDILLYFGGEGSNGMGLTGVIGLISKGNACQGYY
jgi:RHS repeat-associated protein